MTDKFNFLPIYLSGIACLGIATSTANKHDPGWGWFLFLGVVCTLAGSSLGMALRGAASRALTPMISAPAMILMLISGRMYVTNASGWGWFLATAFFMLVYTFFFEIAYEEQKR